MDEPPPMRDEWERNAGDWVAWARKPGHDSYWKFHRDVFRELLPPPSGRVLDVGCGEGRLPRDMKSWGYSVVGVDGSPQMIRAAQEADPEGDYRVSDAASLPFDDGSFELVTAFMSLHDIDDFESAVREIGRVVSPGGYLCAAITHPFQTSGQFESSSRDARFVMDGSYFEARRVGGKPYVRDGMSMIFHSVHRPLHDYVAALASSGFAIDRLVESPDWSDPPGDRWRRMPLFLDFRARKI
jgi:ubiquinone/menaquinone biosynthesis C-methylase UbiE